MANPTDRKVSVKFDGDQSGLDRSTKAGARSLSRWNDGLDKVSKAFGRTGRESDTAVGKVNSNLTKVDGQLKATRDRLDGLTRKFAETGDIKLFRDMARDTSLIKKLESVQRQLGGAGDDGGRDFVDAFAAQVAPLLGKLPMGPWMAPAVAAAAPVLAATIGGAVTAGVALGVTGIGVKLATQDAAVQAAGKQLGAEFSRGLVDASKPFVPATLKAIDIIRDEFQDLRPELRALFADAAKYVEPLSRAAAGFVRNLLPGLREATRNAEPLIDTLGEHGPKAAKAFGDALATLSENSEQNARALDALLTSVEFGITSAATNINILTKMIPLPGDALLKWVSGSDGLTKKMLEVPPKAQAVAVSLDAISNSTNRSTAEFDAMTASINGFTGAAMGSERANLAMKNAFNEAAAAGQRNDAGIRGSSAAALENRTLLLGVIDTTNTYAQAVLDQTGNQDKATAAAVAGRARFMEIAASMKVGKAEAAALAAELFRFPVAKNIPITVDTRQALAQAENLRQRISNMKARMGIETYKAGTYGGVAHSGEGNAPGIATGGYVRGPGSSTSDSIPARLSNGEYVIRAAAVRQLGVGVLNQVNNAGPGSGRAVLADRDYLGSGARGASMSPSTAATPAAVPPVNVQVFVGDREITDIVDVRISQSNRQLRRQVGAGSGATQ